MGWNTEGLAAAIISVLQHQCQKTKQPLLGAAQDPKGCGTGLGHHRIEISDCCFQALLYVLLQVVSPLFTGDLTLQHSTNRRRCFPQKAEVLPSKWPKAGLVPWGITLSVPNRIPEKKINGTLLVLSPGCSFQHGNYWFPGKVYIACAMKTNVPRFHLILICLREGTRDAAAWMISHDYNWQTSKTQKIQCQKCGAWCGPVILEQVHTPCHTAMTSSHTILILPFPVAKWFVI